MDDLRTVLGCVFPGREPAAVRTLGRGNHKRTTVVEFGDETVVVQRSSAPEALRTEAALARAVRARTAVPTPRLLATGTVDGTGYVVAEHAPGADLHERFTDLPPGQRRDIARSFGGFLAELHEAFAFDACGPVTYLPASGADAVDGAGRTIDGADGDGDDPDGDGDDPDGEFRAEGPATWRAWFDSYAREGVAALPAAFDDLRSPLLDAFSEATTAERAPRLYPWDLRPGNALVVDGAVSAVLDWGAPLAAPPGVAVAKVEHLLVEWYVSDPRLRTAFREGYGAERGYPSPTRAERLVAVVRSAVDSTGEVTRPGYPERTGADAVSFHRRRLQEQL